MRRAGGMGVTSMGKQRFGPKDYNDTTEPVERVVLPPPAAPNYAGSGLYPDAWAVPAPQTATRPFPQGTAPDYSYDQSPPVVPYPVLPPPKKYRGQPPGGAAPFYQPARKFRRSPVPGLVGFGLLLVQLALLARVVCMMLNVQPASPWLALLFAASDLFVGPVRWLAANVNLSVLAGTQLLLYLEFLLAVLMYGLVSRLLVRLLKALLNPW